MLGKNRPCNHNQPPALAALLQNFDETGTNNQVFDHWIDVWMHLILGDLTVRDKNRKFGSVTIYNTFILSSLLECPFYASCKTYTLRSKVEILQTISFIIALRSTV